jgi:hypothetical protein
MQSSLPASSFQSTLSTEFVQSDPARKKNKKRSRDYANADTSQSDAPKEKKKKRKHNDGLPGDTSVATSTEQDAGVAVDPSKQERKKTKKDKGKSKDNLITPAESSNVSEPQISVEVMDEEAQASTAALLSAIVAAATAAAGSPDMMNAPPPQQLGSHYPPTMMPNGQPHFIPMGPEQPHPYPLPPHMQPVPDPSVFSNMGLPFSDLSFGSNEDVLRALQDLDIGKIANVLKALGDAAAAANVPPLEQFPPPPMFFPISLPPQLPAPVVPAPSNAILGIPSKKPPCPRVVHPLPSVSEQHGNPDHARLLATKWLGAAKLAELVRTEGMSTSAVISALYSWIEQGSFTKRENFLR